MGPACNTRNARFAHELSTGAGRIANRMVNGALPQPRLLRKSRFPNAPQVLRRTEFPATARGGHGCLATTPEHVPRWAAVTRPPVPVHIKAELKAWLDLGRFALHRAVDRAMSPRTAAYWSAVSRWPWKRGTFPRSQVTDSPSFRKGYALHWCILIPSTDAQRSVVRMETKQQTNQTANTDPVRTQFSLPREHSNILASVAAENRVFVTWVDRDAVSRYIEDNWPQLHH